MNKIYKVTFNNGGWHSGDLPNIFIVASSKNEAISKARGNEEGSRYKTWDAWASEFKLDGYGIEVYSDDEYKGEIRDRKIHSIENG